MNYGLWTTSCPLRRQKYKLPHNYYHYCGNSLFLAAMIQFKVEGEFIPLIQLLKATNLVQTGGEAQIVVSEGLVMYNGHVDYRKRLKVRPGDTVEFEKNTITVI